MTNEVAQRLFQRISLLPEKKPGNYNKYNEYYSGPTSTAYLHAGAEALLEGFVDKPDIRRAKIGGKPGYAPDPDWIQMPPPEAYDAPHYYYRSLFHELVHSTGHRTRANREGIEVDPIEMMMMRFMGPSPDYAREELVAEIGAAILSDRAGLDASTEDYSAEYIKNYMDGTGLTATDFFSAADEAAIAVDYILNHTHDRELVAA